MREVKRTFTFWKIIKEPPKWVEAAHERWKDKLPTAPYNMTKHFVGKNHIYKVIHGMLEQGQAPVLNWYIKKKIV